MKKLLVVLSLLMVSCGVFAADNSVNSTSANSNIVAGKQYSVLKNVKSPDKTLVEVFSFNCPSCYSLDMNGNATQIIKDNLDKDISFKKYHLDNFGPLAPELSEAWAIANVKGIEKEVSVDLYNGIQKSRNIKTGADVKAVFEKFGIDSEQYDKLKNSFMVKAFMKQQSDVIKELRANSIPSFYVNGIYAINQQGLKASTQNEMIMDYVAVANYLANRE